jgi:hypothetical protein
MVAQWLDRYPSQRMIVTIQPARRRCAWSCSSGNVCSGIPENGLKNRAFTAGVYFVGWDTGFSHEMARPG